MAISRAQMRTQLKGNKMKKPTKKMKGGKLINMLSPVAAIANSIKSGKPEGIMQLSPLAHMLSRANSRGKSPAASVEDDEPKSKIAAKSIAAKSPMAKRMKKGGAVKGRRGDGICQRGKTKGTMR